MLFFLYMDSNREESIYRYFYEDMKEIVDAYIKSLNQKANP